MSVGGGAPGPGAADGPGVGVDVSGGSELTFAAASVVETAGHPGRALGDAIVPGLERLAARVVHHRDAARHRADVGAQVAARALVPVRPRRVHAGRHLLGDRRLARRGAVVRRGVVLADVDAVYRGVATGDVTEIAADALLGVDVRRDLVVQIEVAPLGIRFER